eukprot:4167137-Karenia_brevis.AAC.1
MPILVVCLDDDDGNGDGDDDDDDDEDNDDGGVGGDSGGHDYDDATVAQIIRRSHHSTDAP